MAWQEVFKFTLIPSMMCAGERDFTPYIPYDLIGGLQPGKYKIEYISGAVRSHNRYRYKSYIPQFTLKWNKYYKFTECNITNFSQFDYTFFPQEKFNVLQCQFGTLPGFTSIGTNTSNLAGHFSAGKNIPQELYNYIYEDIKPLQFELTKFSTISFWYTDNCAPCVEGSMTYAMCVEREIENLAINGLSVISYNVKSLKKKNPEYYNLQQKITNINNTIYTYQEKLLETQLYKKHILDIKKYNTISYYKNSKDNNGIYQSYAKNYNNTYTEDIYWKLTKIKNITNYNILTELTANKTIPLFYNTYTLIPNTGKQLSGKITYNNTEYNLSGMQYTFKINKSTFVNFNTNAYLYTGTVLYEELINNKTETDNELAKNYIYDKNIIYNDNLIESNETEPLSATIEKYSNRIAEKILIKDKSIINNDYYIYIDIEKSENNVYIITGTLKIITNVEQGLIKNNIDSILGPFNSLQDAINEAKKYFFINEYQYEEVDNITYVFAKEDNLNV